MLQQQDSDPAQETTPVPFFGLREALRADGALMPTRALGDELLGELQKHTHAAVARLARLSNDPAASAYARLWANEAIVRCYQRFVETACRMQYVEPGAKRIRHHQHRKDAEAGVGPPRPQPQTRQTVVRGGVRGCQHAGRAPVGTSPSARSPRIDPAAERQIIMTNHLSITIPLVYYTNIRIRLLPVEASHLCSHTAKLNVLRSHTVLHGAMAPYRSVRFL